VKSIEAPDAAKRIFIVFLSGRVPGRKRFGAGGRRVCRGLGSAPRQLLLQMRLSAMAGSGTSKPRDAAALSLHFLSNARMGTAVSGGAQVPAVARGCRST